MYRNKWEGKIEKLSVSNENAPRNFQQRGLRENNRLLSIEIALCHLITNK